MKSAETTIQSLRRALEDSALVQSFSGVRTTFGQGPEISEQHELLAVAHGFAYAKRALADIRKGILLVGRDPRPTGKAVAAALARGFLAGAECARCRLTIVDLGVITTPLIETAVPALNANGGVMITASHNPLADNGFKFLTGVQADDSGDSGEAPPGALLSASAMATVLHDVRAISENDASEFLGCVRKIDDRRLARALGAGEDHASRVKAERAYLDFIGGQWGIQPHCLKPLVLGPVLLDPNGGSACGIGARVLEHFGVRAIEVNAELGYPEHSIDTDGIDPASGRHMLLRVARAASRSGARFGIAFDYDADRGNIVLPGLDESAIIHPQTVAAVSIALALTHREIQLHDSEHTNRLAVVMSDATSVASEKVAALFGAEVHMVETGEINVVTRMHQLRREGYDVPAGVEGANGGTILGESTCRDGLQTALCAALGDEQPVLAKQWLEVLRRNGRDDLPGADRSSLRFPEIIAAIPLHYNRMFRLAGPAIPHGEIKTRMEEHFKRAIWPQIGRNYRSYSFLNFEGTGTVEHRTGDETGGWRIDLEDGRDKAFIFARGSRTEAGVWRVIIDDSDESRGAELAEAGLSLVQAATDGQAVLVRR